MTTSGWRSNLTPYNNRRNRPADSRFVHSSYPHAPRVHRGVLYNIDASSLAIGAGSRRVVKRHVFHFLTNPWTLSLGYRVDEGLDLTIPETWASLSANTPNYTDGLLSVNFSLLLDRTYEVWDGSMPEGVLHDISQLERVLGVPDTGAVAVTARNLGGPISGDQTGAKGQTNVLPGVIAKRPVRVIFGGRHSYTFDGFVENLSIELMKFDASMAPTRAGVNMSLSSWGTSTPGVLGDSGSGGSFNFGGQPSTAPGSGNTNIPSDLRIR